MQATRIGALLAAGALSAVAVSAQSDTEIGPHSISANIGAVSNYIWRGQTQTDDQAAVQGGLDYANTNGLYAGTWVSNIDWGDGGPTYEMDFYGGFAGSINEDFSYDLSAIYYAYPDGRDNDFAEIGASGTYKWLTAGIAYTVYGQADDAPGVSNGQALYIQGDLYYHASLDFDLPFDLGLSVFGGYYDFRYNDGGNDYGHWGASISRDAGDFGTFSLNYDQIGRDTYDEDPKFWVGWLKEF